MKLVSCFEERNIIKLFEKRIFGPKRNEIRKYCKTISYCSLPKRRAVSQTV
jgi:hypothetical protein